MSHVPIVGWWPSRSCDRDSSSCKGAESQCRCLVPTPLRGLLRVVTLVIWGSQWVRFLRGTSLLLHSAASRAAGGARWAISKVCTIRVLRRSSRWPDVDSCIGGWVRFCRRWRVGAVISFGYGGCAWYRSGNDGYAFPGRQQGRARVESSTVSWTLKAGRLVSRGGTSWFSATHPGFLSSRRCMKSSLVRGRHLLLPETAPEGPPPSPPLMAVRLRVTRASPLWSGPWLCSCALTPPGAGSRLSLPGPVSTRQTLPAGLTRPVGKLPPPYTLWRCCRSIRPRHWETCTRVVMTHKFITNFVLRWTSRFGRWRLRRG